MAEIPFEQNEEGGEGSGINFNGNDIPQERVDFLANMLKLVYGPTYLQDQIKEKGLSPETTWNDIVTNQINQPDFPQMIEIISENITLALHSARELDEAFLKRISSLDKTEQQIEMRKAKIAARRDYRLNFGSDYRDINLKLAFEYHVDSLEFWNKLLLTSEK